jgi:uncharacterized repeat protein (TIGR01451 family)
MDGRRPPLRAGSPTRRQATAIVAVAALLLAPRLAGAATDLQLRMSVDTPVPSPGQTVEFTVTVVNVGAEVASGVQVQDELPAGLGIPAGLAAYVSMGSFDGDSGLWRVGSLSPAASATLVLPAVVTAVVQPACLVNVATLQDTPDSNAANDRALAAVRRNLADRCADLSIQVEPTFTWNCVKSNRASNPVRVTNLGPDVATDVLVDLGQDPTAIPNLRLTGPASVSCIGTRCSIAALAAGSTVDLRAASSTFLNQPQLAVTLEAVVSSSETDYATSNNQSATTQIFPAVSSRCDEIGIDEGWAVGVVGCFIATAAYGSPLEPHVVVLREFRDRHLQRSAPGRAFVRFYYRHSPPLAAAIARHDSLRFIARLLLMPLVLAIAYPLQVLALVIGAGLTVFGICGIGRGRRAR